MTLSKIPFEVRGEVPDIISVSGVSEVFDAMQYKNFVAYLGGMGLSVDTATANELGVVTSEETSLLVGDRYFAEVQMVLNAAGHNLARGVATRSFNAMTNARRRYDRVVQSQRLNQELCAYDREALLVPDWMLKVSPNSSTVDLLEVKIAYDTGRISSFANFGERCLQFTGELLQYTEAELTALKAVE